MFQCRNQLNGEQSARSSASIGGITSDASGYMSHQRCVTWQGTCGKKKPTLRKKGESSADVLTTASRSMMRVANLLFGRLDAQTHPNRPTGCCQQASVESTSLWDGFRYLLPAPIDQTPVQRLVYFDGQSCHERSCLHTAFDILPVGMLEAALPIRPTQERLETMVRDHRCPLMKGVVRLASWCAKGCKSGAWQCAFVKVTARAASRLNPGVRT